MSELISEIEAFTAWKNGQDVEIYDESMCWHPLLRDHGLCVFDSNGRVKFRLKPHTITINGIEVPAPFEPNKDDDCRVYVIDTRNICGWDWQHSSHFKSGHIVWRTEEEIKQVVAALRSVFGKK